MTSMSQVDADSAVLERIADRVVRKWDVLELPTAIDCGPLRTSQRYLSAAGNRVGLTLLNMRLSREVTKTIDKKDPAGRLSHMEMDLLRAAIVFAGAGLDATLKELIRSALPIVVTTNAVARDKFRRFASDFLGNTRQSLDFDELAAVLVAA